MFVFPACLTVHHIHAMPIAARRGHRPPGPGVTDLNHLVGARISVVGGWDHVAGASETAVSALNHGVITPVPGVEF